MNGRRMIILGRCNLHPENVDAQRLELLDVRDQGRVVSEHFRLQCLTFVSIVRKFYAHGTGSQARWPCSRCDTNVVARCGADKRRFLTMGRKNFVRPDTGNLAPRPDVDLAAM